MSLIRLGTHVNRIVWIFIADEKAGSSRIHGYNIHKKLLSLGYNSFILFRPHIWLDEYVFQGVEDQLADALDSGDLLIVQKIKSREFIGLFEKVKAKGIRVVFVDCDLPIARYYKNAVDIVICPSKYIRELYIQEGFTDVYYIEDAPEAFIYVEKKPFSKKCLWFGQSSGNKWESVVYLRSIFKKYRIDWTLHTLSNTAKADILWDDNAFKKIAEYDAVLISDVERATEESKVKSANRVLQSMALGVPVVAHSIPSYDHIIEHEKDGFLIKEDSDWKKYLDLLAEDILRDNIRRNGYSKAQQYSIDHVISTWIKVLDLKPGQSSNRELKVLKGLIYKSMSRHNYYYRKVYLQLEESLLRKLFFRLKWKAKNTLRAKTLA